MEENKIIRPVYDERDESIGLLAKGAAWNVVLGAAQAAAMVCAVQGNPAWRVCLGLVLLGIGANLVARFGEYREGRWLAAGLASGGAGIALLLWFVFLPGAAYPGGNWLALVVGVVLPFLLQKGAALVFVLAVLLFFWIKGKAGHMDEETWDAWFRGLPNGAYGGLFLGLYALPLALLSAVGYLLWAWLGLAAPTLLAGLTFLFGLLGALRKLDAHKGELWEKLRNIC